MCILFVSSCQVLGPHYLHGWPELPREHVAGPGVELLGGLATLRRVRRLGQLVERLVQVPRALEARLRLRGHGFILQYNTDIHSLWLITATY